MWKMKSVVLRPTVTLLTKTGSFDPSHLLDFRKGNHGCHFGNLMDNKELDIQILPK